MICSIPEGSMIRCLGGMITAIARSAGGFESCDIAEWPSEKGFKCCLRVASGKRLCGTDTAIAFCAVGARLEASCRRGECRIEVSW